MKKKKTAPKKIRLQRSEESKNTLDFSGGSVVKNLPANTGDADSIPGQEDPLEKEMATQSNILVWEIPWTEKPGWVQFMGLQNSLDLSTKQQKYPMISILLTVCYI